jgi:riboflavin kinase/FMN adenylyltransferase
MEMKLVDKDSGYKLEKGTYIAFGSFDGLHIGHRRLIDKAKLLALKNESLSMVYTFKNHPLTVVNKDKVPKLIMDNNTKMQVLDKLGVDISCFTEFNESFMRMSPEDFIRHIKQEYNMKGLVVGFNYRFGHKNAGNTETLKYLGDKYNFEVYVMDALKYEDEIVSSSNIRNLLIEGNIERANKMLVQPFKITGEVIHGKKLGRTLGFPTANLKIYEELLYPQIGVYYTNVVVKDKVYKAITSVGFNPTVYGKDLTFESYILDFDEYIYDEFIDVYFINKIRDEMKFDNLDGLMKQLTMDKEYAINKKIELKSKK